MIGIVSTTDASWENLTRGCENLMRNHWWYLHGELEDYFRYDMADFYGDFPVEHTRETIPFNCVHGSKVISVESDELVREVYMNGEFDVCVHGVSEPCKGFFWTTEESEIFWSGKSYPSWYQRGLVCFASDIKACEYARSMMGKRSNNI